MNGPQWLCAEENWPKWTGRTSILFAREENGVTAMTKTMTKTQGDRPEGIGNVMDASRYSSYRKLLRITGYVMRFVENCKLGRNERRLDALSASDLQRAGLRWIRYEQQCEFGGEIESIR